MSKNKEQVINFSKVEHSGFQHFFWPETHNESLSFRNKLNKEQREPAVKEIKYETI